MGGGAKYSVSEKAYRWWYDSVHSHYYDLLVAWCFLPFGGEKKARAHLIEEIQFGPGERILEMCCGTGKATFIIAEKAPADVEIIGLDLSTGQIRIARKKNRFPNVRFVEGDASDTGFGSGSFDKVMITHAVHEMFHDLRLKIFREARRLLKNHGQLIVLEVDNPKNLLMRLFTGFWFFYWLPFNIETPTRREMFRLGLENEIAEAGFACVQKLSKHRGVFQVVTAAR